MEQHVTGSETKSLQDLKSSNPEAKAGVDQEGSGESVPELRKDSSASGSLAPTIATTDYPGQTEL